MLVIISFGPLPPPRQRPAGRARPAGQRAGGPPPHHQGLFPRIVFTGANAPTTIERFPRGEAVHYRDHAVTLGVPADVISVETNATNTSQNLTYSRKVLDDAGAQPTSVLLICRPYQQRRAYATRRKVWPEVEVVCSSRPLPLAEYIASIGDIDRVINMLVGDIQRITEIRAARLRHRTTAARRGRRRLPAAGRRWFTSRLI
jgi:uncharacterized SAM-binding protein YcdF (DUF218 family)